MTGKRIDILWAFIVGGLLSVVTEALWWIIVALGLPVDSWAITVMLIVLAFVGMVTSYLGWFQRLVGLAGFGAFLPFCSLPCSIILDYTAARGEGASMGKAVFKGLKGPIFVFGTGISFSVVMALLVFWVQGFEGMLGQLMGAAALESTPMSVGLYVKAFLVGGLICALWQVFFRINKQSVTLNMAIGIYTGAVLTAIGAMERFISFAGRGVVLQIHDTGEAVYRWFSAILLFGDFAGLLRFCLLLAFVFIGSTVIFGEAFFKKTAKAKQK